MDFFVSWTRKFDIAHVTGFRLKAKNKKKSLLLDIFYAKKSEANY